MTRTMTPPVLDSATDTCPVCHGNGFVTDGDCVTYCDAPGCFDHVQELTAAYKAQSERRFREGAMPPLSPEEEQRRIDAWNNWQPGIYAKARH